MPSILKISEVIRPKFFYCVGNCGEMMGYADQLCKICTADLARGRKIRLREEKLIRKD